ncbi:MAG: ribokinase [Bacteroidetes bacterium]|nr:ribokinase [Bacteroidota bacterium]
MIRIAVVGSINKDVIMQVERHPKPGETLTAVAVSAAFGGKGANQAVAAARLGAEVTMIGAVGEDSTGDEQIEHFRNEGIRTDAVMRCSEPSGVAYITVDSAGENSIILYPGANHQITVEWVEKNRSYIEDADVLLLQLEIPVEVSLAAAEIADKSDTIIIFNPAPVHPIPERLFELTDIITPNETELALLSGEDDPERAEKILLGKGVKSVLATMGADGSKYRDAGFQFSLPTYSSVKVADTTAAGDSFNAAVAFSVGSGDDIADAAAFATAVGSITVSRFGAQTSLPTMEEVEKFIIEHQGELK